MKQFPHHAFREYDIRGIAGSDIDETLAIDLAHGFAAMLPEHESRPIIVGRDVRLSGHALQQAVISGLNNAGYDVLDIGIAPTPLAYFAVHELNAAGSIHVTASHNPGEYNGFKMLIGTSSLHGSDIQHLKTLMMQQHGRATSPGTCTPCSIVDAYLDFVADDCPLQRPLKIAVDAGNGPSGLIAPPLYRKLGCEVIELYCEPDGRFPNHHPDPSVARNLIDLQQVVSEHECDLGIAFDGDGDRIGIVDAGGTIIASDMLLLLLSRQLLKQRPGATIISEVKSSKLLYDDIAANGGKCVMWRTGHSPIKAKMKETGALLAGEMSGHLFFADRFFGFDDATYAGARVMQLLTESDSTLSAMLHDLPHRECTPEIRIACSDERKFDLVNEATTHFRAQGYEIIDIDGMRINLGESWGLLRASNTEAALVMRFEAPDLLRLQQIRALLEQWLRQHHLPI